MRYCQRAALDELEPSGRLPPVLVAHVLEQLNVKPSRIAAACAPDGDGRRARGHRLRSAARKTRGPRACTHP